MRVRRPQPHKLRHRPSDELIDIRERGLPWLISVFLVLFVLLTLILIYFIFTTRDIYLSQRDLFAKNEQKEPPIDVLTSSSEKDDDDKDVHVDIIPIVNRLTGLPDALPNSHKSIDTTTTATTTTTILQTTTVPITTPITTETITTTTQQIPEIPEKDNENSEEGIEEDKGRNKNEAISTEQILTSTMPSSISNVLDSVEGEDLDDIEVEEYIESSSRSTTTTTTTESPPTTSSAPTTTSSPKNEKMPRVKWNRQVRSQSHQFDRFAISTHHEECSKIGRSIFEKGGNAIDSSIAAEICISALHPHSTGPGFGAVILVTSRKRNGTYVIDGRERAAKIVNQNTFVINPSIAHIGYSSMGIPGWISTLWNAFKQFGSSKITWKQLFEPTISLIEKRIHVDRLLQKAFESRKNHILHEKSFNTLFDKSTREGGILDNKEYLEFLRNISQSNNAEHEFYSGPIAKIIYDEIKSRGGLISRQDLESYSSVVTRSEILPIGNNFLAGPHLPYTFPILAKIFKELAGKYSKENPEELIEYYDDFIQLLQKANHMKMLVGDDIFEPEIKLKIDELEIPKNFEAEEQIGTNSERKSVQSFSRILAVDQEGNSINLMSTNSVPFGSVRRSPKYGFVWNNAMSSFDVFCRHNINCVRGGKRAAVQNILPSILLDENKYPLLLISPTTAALETTSAIVLQKTIMNLTTAISLDSPRIYPHSSKDVKIETGVPDELYRHLWNTHEAKYAHPSHPVTLIAVTPKIEVFCDFRQFSTTQTCFPGGL